jgi:hypothetical protein
MWVAPDEAGAKPDYAQVNVEPAALEARFVVVASGRAADRDTAVTIACRGAVLRVGRLGPGQSARLPDADLVHLFVARGSVHVEPDLRLDEGDSACLKCSPGLKVSGLRDCEVLVWDLDSPCDSA